MGNAAFERVIDRHDADKEAAKLASLFGASIKNRFNLTRLKN